MDTQFTDIETIASENMAVKYSVTDAIIQELADKYLPLKIDGITDKSGLSIVHEARMEVKGYRLDVERTRKNLKEDSLAWGRRVDSEAKRITAKLEPIEGHLEAEENRIKAELERVQEEKRQAQAKKMQDRMDALNAVKAVFDYTKLVLMSDEHYTDFLKVKTAEFEAAEKSRIEQEAELARFKAEKEAFGIAAAKEAEALRKAEEARQAAERAALDEERKKFEAEKAEQAKQAAAIKAQADALEAAKRKIEADVRAAKEAEERKAREEQIRKEAEAAAIAKAQAEAERKAKEEQAKKEAEEARLKAIAAAAPDADKLTALQSVIESIALPEMKTKQGKESLSRISSKLDEVWSFIDTEIKILTK